MADFERIEELERLLQEAELRAEKEKQRAETSEEQIRSTTLSEYITACHRLVFSRFTVERDKSLTSKGSITNPRNKLCPASLKPWPNFIELQRIASGVLYDAFPENARLFESRNFLAGLGDRISLRPVANEKGLEYFLHNSVEDPVSSILHQLKEVEQIRNVYNIGGGIIFENHPSAISDAAEEVVERETLSPPRTPDHGRVSNQLRPDQICVYRSDDMPSARRNMVYVCEYKAPHKLTTQHLRAGLRPMNVYKEVVNRKTIPTSADPDALFQYHAERLTAAAICLPRTRGAGSSEQLWSARVRQPPSQEEQTSSQTGANELNWEIIFRDRPNASFIGIAWDRPFSLVSDARAAGRSLFWHRDAASYQRQYRRLP